MTKRSERTNGSTGAHNGSTGAHKGAIIKIIIHNNDVFFTGALNVMQGIISTCSPQGVVVDHFSNNTISIV